MTAGQVAYEAAVAKLAERDIKPHGPAWRDMITTPLTWESAGDSVHALWEAIAQAVIDAQPAP